MAEFGSGIEPIGAKLLTWREAVWAAVQRQCAKVDTFTRQQLIAEELPAIIAEVGSVGETPSQTLSRILQELRDDGIILFDGQGRYRISEGIAGQSVDAAAATEQWKLQKTRLGQGAFRTALLRQWEGRCPLTGISEPGLLRASHIIPWNRCESDAERRNPDNGLLLSALWDAAFDRGLVTFADDGTVIRLPALSRFSFEILCKGNAERITRLSLENRKRLHWHRSFYAESKS